MNLDKRTLLIGGGVLAALFAVICVICVAASLLAPDTTSTPEAERLAEEMLTPIPIDTPIPVPTDTPVPVVVATDTPIPLATDTPVPTDALVPTATDTPVPTETPVPMDTPVPMATDTPVPTETPIPTDTPIPMFPIVKIVRVDKEQEFVDIQNEGGVAQDLGGWMLRSERGSQDCPLGGVLEAGATLRIWAMAEDAGQGGYNCGFGENIWNNDEEDRAILFDAGGGVVDQK